MKDPTLSVINREVRKQAQNDNIFIQGSSRRNRTRRKTKIMPQEIDASTSFMPWLDLIPEREYHTIQQRLHDEIIAYTNYIRPTPQEAVARQTTLAQIQKAVKKRFPYATLDLFGSCATGLYLPTSDMDIVMSIGSSPHTTKKILFQLSSTLKTAGLTHHVVVNHHARVPIVTFTTLPQYGSFSVDIGINNVDGLKGTEIIKGYLVRMPALTPLIMVVKAFLLQRGLNDASRATLGSYTITCMCISFLQLNPGKRPQLLIDKPLENESLGALITDFMLYYGLEFPYTTSCISISEGRLVPKDYASWVKDPNADRLSIQCLINPENDAARAVGDWRRIKGVFKDAYGSLLQLSAVDRNTLGYLVAIPQETILRRAEINDLIDSRRPENPSTSHPKPPSPQPKPTKPRETIQPSPNDTQGGADTRKPNPRRFGGPMFKQVSNILEGAAKADRASRR